MARPTLWFVCVAPLLTLVHSNDLVRHRQRGVQEEFCNVMCAVKHKQQETVLDPNQVTNIFHEQASSSPVGSDYELRCWEAFFVDYLSFEFNRGGFLFRDPSMAMIQFEGCGDQKEFGVKTYIRSSNTLCKTQTFSLVLNCVGCASYFTCPSGAVPIPGLSCVNSFEDCECVNGFTRVNQECIPSQPGRQCERTSGVFGDPHISTFDGLRFECQASGEFTTLTSLDTPQFLIQERFTNVGDRSMCAQASVSTGVVMRDDFISTVQVSIPRSPGATGTDMIDSCPLDIFVNGMAVDIASAGSVASAVSIEQKGSTVELLSWWGVGIAATVRRSQTFGCFLLVQVTIPCTYRPFERLVGLLGTPNGNRNDDWVAADGTVLFPPVNDNESTFSPAYNYCTQQWCNRDSAYSLFTYRQPETFYSIRQCDSGYDAAMETAIANAPQEILDICGRENVPCLVDGVCGTLSDAVAALNDQRLVELVDLTNPAPSTPTVPQTSPPTLPPTLPPAQQNEQVTCVSVIDENDGKNVNTRWAELKEKFPDRPFCLLQPVPAQSRLSIPDRFEDSPPVNIFAEVTRQAEDDDLSTRSDWFDLCDLAGSKARGLTSVVLFIDNSGSLVTRHVQGALDDFRAKVTANGMEVVSAVENRSENYIDPCILTDL